MHTRGPANCTTDASEDFTGVSSRSPSQFLTERSPSDALLQDVAATEDAADEDQCAGVLDGGVDSISALRIWGTIMKKYKVAQMCDQEITKLNAKTDLSQKEELLRTKAIAVAEAVDHLAKLHHRETRTRLNQLFRQSQSHGDIVKIGHADVFLSNRDHLFWTACFMRLFPRGDCAERCVERKVALALWRWAKCLLTRADFPGWRLDVEFVATLYNVFLRRDQVAAVEASVRNNKLTAAAMEEVQKITATSLVALSLIHI